VSKAKKLNEQRILLDFLLPPLLGILATLGFAPFDWYPLTVLAFAGLMALWWRANPKRAAWRGWLFGLGHFGSGVYWVFVSTYYYGGAPLPVAVLLVCLLSAYMALYPALVGAFAAACGRLPRAVWALLLVPAAWVLAELVRARLGTGFPWLSAGYALTDAGPVALAPLGGVYLFGLLLLVLAGALVLLFARGLPGKAAAVAVFAALPLGLWLLPAAQSWTRPAGEPLAVAILQGNVPQDMKWLPSMHEPTLARYRALNDAAEGRLIVWPEAAVPALAHRVPEYLQAIDAEAARRQRTLLVGVLQWPAREAPLYNAVYALGADHGRYYKRHLVPFGEYFPVPDFLRALMDGVNMRYSNFDHGPEEQTPITVEGVALGISICFEDVFAYEIRKALPAAGLLINMTNDAWFDRTSAPYQHLQIARMRAMETGRPLLRATQTGISAAIDADGRILARSAHYAPDIVETRVQPRSGATPYVRHGDLPLALVALAICAFGFIGPQMHANGRK
jgi:apolipoprotein N-acyltransferase